MRVAHRCSNPDCRVPTIGPGDGSDGVAHFGKAAHITAASPGGPRYLASISSSERSSFDNGIWLCSNCATEIDAAPYSYPTELLHEWKRLAEEAARREKGKPLPRDEDIRNQLVSAFSGQPTSFMGTAIQNVHGATEQVLQCLDPRFRVETAYKDKVTTYTVHALEDAHCTVQIPGELAKEWESALESLMDHGQEVTVPAAGVRMKGSPLLERMFSNVGLQTARISLGGNKRQALQKLRLLNPATEEVEQFDDVLGYVWGGRKSVTFEGAACSGLFHTSCVFHWGSGGKTDFTWCVKPDPWCRRDVRYLPHFDKLSRFFERLASGWNIQLELEIEGLNVVKGTAKSPMASDEVQAMDTSLRYLALIRKIATFLDTEIQLLPEYQVSPAEHLHASEVVEIIEGRAVYGIAAINSNATCRVVAQDGASNIRLLAESTSPSIVTIQGENETGLVVFGQTIRLPRTEVLLSGVRPKIHHEDMSNIRDGDTILVEWEPTEGFQCSWRYLKAGEVHPACIPDQPSQPAT